MRSRAVVVVGICATMSGMCPVSIDAAIADDSLGGKAPPSSLATGQSSPVDVPDGRVVCGTALGEPFDDAVLSFEGDGIDLAAAADFRCAPGLSHRQRTFTSLTVAGTEGDKGSTMFDVTVYGNDHAGIAQEPRNGAGSGASRPARVVCATQRVRGTPTGGSFDLTVIGLVEPCTAKPRRNWIEVQAVSEDNAWYWRLQSNIGGKFPADLRDSTYGTDCAPGYNDDVYMSDCWWGTDPERIEVMFELNR